MGRRGEKKREEEKRREQEDGERKVNKENSRDTCLLTLYKKEVLSFSASSGSGKVSFDTKE